MKDNAEAHFHHAFLYDFLRELDYLSENNPDPEAMRARKCTVELRAMICDAPMRSYLKGTIGHSGFCSCERCTIRYSFFNTSNQNLCVCFDLT